MSRCLVAVAMGAQYVKQTEPMVRSFLEHNPGWEVARYYDGDLAKMLPPQCRSWASFNKCEIGRWCAMQDALKRHDTVLYSDGDIRWYGEYAVSGHQMAIFPHYITDSARRSAKHQLFKDGVANIGILEMSRGDTAEGVFDFIVRACLKYPHLLMHGSQLWLQNIVSCIPECGYDCVWNCHPGLDVASWNLQRQDRAVLKRDGHYVVLCGGHEVPLVSFHFSGKSLDLLLQHGDAVKGLRNAYLRDH